MPNNLFLLVGLPGSGKTTISKKLEKEGTFLVSSDEYRNIFTEFKDNHEFIFSVMNLVSLHALKTRNVVYDSTNLNIINRKNTYEYLKDIDTDINVVAIVLDCSAEYSKKMSKKRPNRTDVTDDLVDFFQGYYKEPIEGIDCDSLIKLSLTQRDNVTDILKEFL
ncbi:hypothetical protein DOK78_002024 [Enterococcus sp. DIV2402]|uniref:Uncharacterized protein n=1 Tax=Candidatus Enterococcus lowellii TaxID=2230877 RepID=A0ABZ2SNM8_9ENTE|nr:AAA family ATPase [Enterococcus sp. DIV2402]MBO0463849.1 AAA family ATPase [Enterococcus sp. DIV2402]